ncbi:hypothetical protein ACFU5Y_25570, partial [Streptomyces gardneri]|uniref:hypothetical protein n=1 Tax=Streptomyces gardneri TaxID=66892 RepID=UPI00368E2CBA
MTVPEEFLDPVALGNSPAQAFASHRERANGIARYFAHMHPLEAVGPFLRVVGEDESIWLMAHLHAAAEDPTFAVNGKPSLELVHEILPRLSAGNGLVGTGEDYDMGLKGLMTIICRYGDLLTAEDYEYILEKLILSARGQPHGPGGLIEGDPISGPHTPLIEFLEAPVLGTNYSETENHLLMIESSRYLVNQILFQRTGDTLYDNKNNGLGTWLLHHALQPVARHDFLEFNSRVYARLSLHSLLNLHEFAKEERIRTAAQILLDYTMTKFALSSTRGHRVAPFRRVQANINHQNNWFNNILSDRGEQVSGYFLAYTGFTGADGNQVRFPGHLTYNALIAGTAAYRPPPAAYILAMDRNRAAIHRFYHGKRPRLTESPEDAEGGLEIYYKSPSFLMSAGGMFLTSGYGNDHLDIFKEAWNETSRAQATTLIPTRRDVAFADLIRFEPFPDPSVDPFADDIDDPDRHHTLGVNIGVHERIIAGMSMRPAEFKRVLETSTSGHPSLTTHGDRVFASWVGHVDPTMGGPPSPAEIHVARVQYTNLLGIAGVEGFADRLAHPAKTIVPPALASHGGRIYSAWKDDDNKLNLSFTDPGPAGFKGAKKFSESSHLSPCLVSHGGRLLLAWIGRGNKKINVAKVALTGNTAGGFLIEKLEDKVVIDHASSDASPALASHNGRLFLAWRGSGNTQLNLSFSNDGGHTFAAARTLPHDSSDFAPCLASHAGRLLLGWTGRGNGKINLAKVILWGNTAGAFGIEGVEDKKVLDASSSDAAPALTSCDGRLFLAFKEEDGEVLELRLSKDGTFERAGPWFWGDLTDIGFYFAAYRIPTLMGATLGFVYAREAGENGMGFQEFKDTVLALNQDLPSFGEAGITLEFRAPFGQDYKIWFQQTGQKYKARITTSADEADADLSKLPLASGEFMRSTGHDGLIEINHPGCGVPVELDFRDPDNPSRKNNLKACPQPWIDRADALRSLAQSLGAAKKHKEAAQAMIDRIKVYEELAKADPDSFREDWADAVFRLLWDYRSSDKALTLVLGEEGLRQYEVLAGLCAAGTTTPVNYGNLTPFTPNQFWDWPQLPGTLFGLALAAQRAGDHTTAATWKIKEIRVWERLFTTDPDKYRPNLADAIFTLLWNYRASDTTLTLTLGEQGLREYEVLAGLRAAGTTTPVNYGNLTPFTPNQFWDWPQLPGTLFGLALAAQRAGDHT